MATLSHLVRKAETGAQWADICFVEAKAVQLAYRHGYGPKDISEVYLADDGSLASVECGTDDEGMARIVLNFSL